MDHVQYPAMQVFPLGAGVACAQPSSFSPIKLDSPAIDAMTDFLSVTPASIPPEASLRVASSIMISRNVRMLFVTDTEHNILGIATARDIHGERPITHVHDRGGRHEELRVADVMIPREQLSALQMFDVLHARVGNILQTLRQMGSQHALVMEWDVQRGKEKVRGMFSATAIGRQLGVPVQIFEVARTFAEIEMALATS